MVNSQRQQIGAARLWRSRISAPGRNVVSTTSFRSVCLAWMMCWFASATISAADPVSLKRPIRADKDVVFAEVKGQKLRADVYRPDDDKLRPAVMMIHGGAWSSGDKWNLSDHARELAQAGYVAVSINYRLAPQWKFPAQIDDCRAALQWLVDSADKYRIDRNRIAVYGYSAGGHLAALLAVDPPLKTCKVTCAVAGGAPCDLSFIPEDSLAVAHVMGGTRSEVPIVYRDASPLTYVGIDDCPMFFFHGTSDVIVPLSSSKALADKLRETGVEVEYLEVNDLGHLVTFVHPTPRRAAIAFLDKYLKPEE